MRFTALRQTGHGPRATRIVVRRAPGRATCGLMSVGGRTLACVLGRSGVRALKREGDGATPRGRYRLERLLYRPDRGGPPATLLPRRPLRPADGWCDDPAHGRYNRPVTVPFRGSHERMWRDDHLYDLVVVLSHNARPRVAGLGSAVFMHLARPDGRPTEGCIALPPLPMRHLLARCRPGTTIEIV